MQNAAGKGNFMIRLIASDLDGTLLEKDVRELDGETIRILNEVVRRNVMFAPASGRQITSLKRLFRNVEQDLVYICENGALVKYKGETLMKSTMERRLGIEIMKDIYSVPNCEILLSGEETSYLMPKSDAYLHRIRDVVKNNVTVIRDFSEVKEDFIKIAVCDLSGIVHSREHFEKKWAGKVQTAVSGELYLDFNAVGVNKGSAVRAIQKKFGIDRKETAVFGDNYNDIEMFHEAEYSFVMETAAEDVKKHAKKRITSVAKTIQTLYS